MVSSEIASRSKLAWERLGVSWPLRDRRCNWRRRRDIAAVHVALHPGAVEPQPNPPAVASRAWYTQPVAASMPLGPRRSIGTLEPKQRGS